MRAITQPDPRRGLVLGAGAVALTLTVFVLNIRFDSKWGAGIHLVYSATAAALVALLALSARREGERPPAWQTMLFATSFFLAFATLANLADVLGSDDGVSSSGTVVWVGLALIALMARYAVGFGSGVSTLLGAVTAIAVALAFVDWVFSPDGLGTFRWILLAVAVALAAAGYTRAARDPEHGNALVVAAGLALLGIPLTFAGEGVRGLFGGDGGVDAGNGWKIVVLAGAAALIAHAVRSARSGPAYAGAANLVAFTALSAASGADGPSLIGWPLVLIVISGALLAVALRPVDGDTPEAAART